MPGAWIRRNVVLPAWDGMRGYSTRSKLRELEASQWFSPDEIADLQWDRLRTLLHHAWNNVPYYRQVMEQAGVTPDELANNRSLGPLPTINRAAINNHREHLIARNISEKRHVTNSTGGSSGHPLRFLDDRAGLSETEAVAWRAQTWIGAPLGARHAYLWGSSLDVSAYEGFLGVLRSLLWNRLTLPAWKLDPEIACDYLAQYQRFRPRVLVGYAGSLYHWARFLDFKPQTIPGMQGIVSTAETLPDDWRDIIEAMFGVPVYNRYGARDFKMIGQECPQREGLHIAAETSFVEIFDGDRPAEPGQLGEIVVTRLTNWAMPFIRYRTGDLGVMSERRCSCGRGLPLLDRVEGRIQDVIQTTSGRVITGPFFGRLRRFPEIVEFQVHQMAFDHLIIKMVTNPPGQLKSLEQIRADVHANISEDMRVDVEFVDEIPLTSNGKRRFTISHLDV